jgi:hypothetical protein
MRFSQRLLPNIFLARLVDQLRATERNRAFTREASKSGQADEGRMRKFLQACSFLRCLHCGWRDGVVAPPGAYLATDPIQREADDELPSMCREAMKRLLAGSLEFLRWEGLVSE